MLLGQSYPEWVLVTAGGILFGYPAVACVIYFVLAAAIFGVPGISHPASIVVEVWGLIEILWYLAFFLPYRRFLQRPGYTPPALTHDERRQLLLQCLDNIPNLDLFQTKWAMNAQLEDIKRENVKDWLLWALYEREGPPGDDDEELEELVRLVEQRRGKPLEPGRGEVEMLRLNFDKVRMLHRSLLWYVVMGFIDFFTTIGMFSLGFRFYRQSRPSFFTTFPFRPMTILAPRASQAPGLSYFYRPHKSTTHRPVVLVHGIGVGLLPYLSLLHSLPKDVGIIAIEILQVSCRITKPLPSTADVTRDISTIVAHHQSTEPGFGKEIILTVQSFGSFYVGSLLRDPTIGPSIHSLVLMDPVSLLLHLPTVAYNFTRRKPSFANELQVWLAVGSDSNVAHALARQFCWREMHLRRSDLIPKPALPGTHPSGLRRTTVIMGGRDSIADPDAVASYVYSGDCKHVEADRDIWKATPENWKGDEELELMYLDGLDHAQALMSKKHVPLLTTVIERYSLRSEEEECDEL